MNVVWNELLFLDWTFTSAHIYPDKQRLFTNLLTMYTTHICTFPRLCVILCENEDGERIESIKHRDNVNIRLRVYPFISILEISLFIFTMEESYNPPFFLIKV